MSEDLCSSDSQDDVSSGFECPDEIVFRGEKDGESYSMRYYSNDFGFNIAKVCDIDKWSDREMYEFNAELYYDCSWTYKKENRDKVQKYYLGEEKSLPEMSEKFSLWSNTFLSDMYCGASERFEIWKEDRFVGLIVVSDLISTYTSLHNIPILQSKDRRFLSISYFTVPEFRSRGVMTAAVRTIKKYIKPKNFLFVCAKASNIGSSKIVEKVSDKVYETNDVYLFPLPEGETWIEKGLFGHKSFVFRRGFTKELCGVSVRSSE